MKYEIPNIIKLFKSIKFLFPVENKYIFKYKRYKIES